LARLEEDQVAGLKTVLRHLHAAMDLLAGRARQIKIRRIAEQVLHQCRAIHAAVARAAPLILGSLPLLVLIENARAQRPFPDETAPISRVIPQTQNSSRSSMRAVENSLQKTKQN
jgi:hypothetical protein